MRIRHGKERSDPRSHISSTLARLRSKSSKNPAFSMMDDGYPLTKVEENWTQDHIAG